MKNIMILALVGLVTACASDHDKVSQTRNSDSRSTERTEVTKTSDKRVQAEDQVLSSDSNVELTRQIRERLMEDERFSVYAQNVTIVTLKNTVTLRGQVKTREERRQVANLAKDIAKTKTIDNQLTVVK